MRFRPARKVLTGFALAIAMGVIASPVLATTTASGETMLGQSSIEPAFDANGRVIYLLTPAKAVINANSHNTAPLYVIMYPTSAKDLVGTMQCAHQPQDNCPDHGPLLAGLAKGSEPSVYGAGVWGHDHLLAAPGNGGDFNVNWLPVAVLFKDSATADNHVTTLDGLDALIAAKKVDLIELPPATFHCSVVAAAVYNNGTPVTPAPGLP